MPPFLSMLSNVAFQSPPTINCVMFKFEVMNSFRICKNFPWSWLLVGAYTLQIDRFTPLQITSIAIIRPSISLTVFYVYDNRRIHKNTNTFAVIWSVREENVTSPFIFPCKFVFWFWESFLQEIKMAILVFQITKDGSSFDTVSYVSNIQSYNTTFWSYHNRLRKGI